MLTFVDPLTKENLRRDTEGNLFLRQKNDVFTYQNYNGTFDFTKNCSNVSEKQFYDDHYFGETSFSLSINKLTESWNKPSEPWYKSFLQSLGDLNGKKILLIGNGKSFRELFFLMKGAHVVYSDLSINVVLHMREIYERSELFHHTNQNIEFHAIDALALPFPDNSFDIIYGCAFVHHLNNFDKFFYEVHRCLKDGGICRFFDQADSPLWSFLKNSILLPLKHFSHKRHPRSPEDIEAEKRKVFNEVYLNNMKDKYCFSEMYFLKEWFLLFLAWRHYGKAVNWDQELMNKASIFFDIIKRLDTILSNYKIMRNNQLTLIWGYQK